PARRLLPALRRARGAERGRHRRTEVGLGLGWGSAAVRGSASPESLRGGRWGRARQGRSGRGSAGARLGENGGAFLVQTRNPGRDRQGRGDTASRLRDPPIPPGPQRRPHLPRDRSSSRSGTPEDIAHPPHRRTSPASPFLNTPGGSRPQGPPGTRALGPAGAPATGPLRPRGAGAFRGREERGQPLPRSSRAPGPRAELARLSPCPCVRPQAAPGAGADRAAGWAQAAPSSACGTWAIAHSSSLPCHPEGAAHLTPARRGRSCLGRKRLQERKPRNAPTGRCRASQRREGPQANTGGFPALSGIPPTAAKVLVRQPSSFPGIKEPTESGGIPRSEAKASVECRRLVPPAGGRLLQGMEELCPGAVPYSPRGVGTGKGLPAAPQPHVHPFSRGKELPGTAPEAPKGQRLPGRRDVLARAQGLPRPGPGARPAPAFSRANTSPGARPGAENRPNSRELAQVPPGTPAGLGKEGYKQQSLWNINLSLSPSG
ncbi:collagen alpha-1(I) chain-like, partial [Manacus candei]|uniref:collagen alpha-1(I) chain-like n=1 Tax=Manacus candei TaxID=415023 RepID=UPI00222637B0